MTRGRRRLMWRTIRLATQPALGFGLAIIVVGIYVRDLWA